MQVSNTWDGNLSGTSTKKWCKSMGGTVPPDPEHAVAEVVEPLSCPIRNTSRCSRVEATGIAIDTEDGEMTDGDPPMPEMAAAVGSEEATLTAVAAVTVAIAGEAMTIGVVALDMAIVIVIAVDTVEVGVMVAGDDED
mmetsp:Transcript_27650/g.60889  ORF Transcript_27650/g.60889 Transcript_27650/m.60889 type:complete len:138 (-) Transcript_27650:84-497(-)